jgi:hypothetical protein
LYHICIISMAEEVHMYSNSEGTETYFIFTSFLHCITTPLCIVSFKAAIVLHRNVMGK